MVRWMYVNTQMQEQIPFKISKQSVSLQDMHFDLDSMTEISDNSIFYIEQMPKRSFEKERYVQVDITIEMNLDHVIVERSHYTFLDVLSDVGGVQSMTMSGFALILSLSNYNHFDNNMVIQLFKFRDRKQAKKGPEPLHRGSVGSGAFTEARIRRRN